MGDVFQTADTKLGRGIAIKFLLEALTRRVSAVQELSDLGEKEVGHVYL